MILKIKNIGAYGGFAAKIIELTVEGDQYRITESVTDMNGKVDKDLIIQLRQIADELEEHNKLFKAKMK